MQYPPTYFGTHPFGFAPGYFQSPIEQYQPYNPYYSRYEPRQIDNALHQFNQPTTNIHDSRKRPLDIPARFPITSGSSPITSGSSPSIDHHPPPAKRPRISKKPAIPVPDDKKDAVYREKRCKNNESAKKSRAMRKEKADRTSKELARAKQVRAQLMGDVQFLRSHNAQLDLEVHSPPTDTASVFHHLAGPSAVQYM